MLIMTSLDNDTAPAPSNCESEPQNVQPEVEDSRSNHSLKSNSSYEYFYCQTCKKEFVDDIEFHDHLKTHIQQPKLILQRIDDPVVKKRAESHKCGPLKFTFRNTNNNFQIFKSPKPDEESTEGNFPPIPKLRILLPEQITEQVLEQRTTPDKKPSERIETPEPVSTNHNFFNGFVHQAAKMVELHTLPNESQSPSFPTQSPSQPHTANNLEQNHFWHSDQPTEDPLAISQSGEKEAETHNNLLQNFLNEPPINIKEVANINNETEYISLERLAEKSNYQCPICGERCLDQNSLDVHQKAMGHYSHNHSSNALVPTSSNSLIPYGQPSLSNALANPLDSITSLPMQQLAQQVNRLQQGGVHQQNVLINIQQFGQPMGQPMAPPPYGRPPEMPPHYPGPGQHYPGQQQPPHMYGGYHPPPMNMNHPMYYPPTSGMYPPMSHNTQSQSMSHPYAPSAPPQPQTRMMPPRAPPPSQQRMAPPPPPSMGQMRPRARMPTHQRGPPPRQMGPRATNPNSPSGNMMRPNMPQQVRPLRRQAPQQVTSNDLAKRKKLDVFLPDTNDNDECSVISVQKHNDGMPIIKSVQGATTSSSEVDPVVHLTDSITLSVRNPKEQPVVQQKKNDAKAVANILATRGITVTPAAKSAQNNSCTSPKSPQKPASPPVAINLNNAVSIIPTARGNNSNNQQKENSRPPRPPTVDLTDDEPLQKTNSAATVTKRALPHHCDLCPAQYPTLQTLMQHRKSYHKIVSQNELGVPVIDLKQQTVLNKLAAIGIHSYIPLPQLGNGTGSFGLPIVSVNAAKNPNICNLGALGSGAVLPLGPLRHLSSSSNTK